ncbi:MAG: 1-acyl-sn-glycerol-3-phosphate acyltransferase, partial [Pseudomonadota bacterium]
MAVLRGALFTVCLYGLMAAMGVLGVVWLWSEARTRAWMKLHNRIAFWLLRWICGIRLEIRGPVPTGRVVVAAKHQSMLDVLMLYNALPEAR